MAHTLTIVSLLSYDGGWLISIAQPKRNRSKPRVLTHLSACEIGLTQQGGMRRLSASVTASGTTLPTGRGRARIGVSGRAVKPVLNELENGLDVSGDGPRDLRGDSQAGIWNSWTSVSSRERSTSKQLESFTRASAVDIGKLLTIAARVQIAHWMSVVADWKKLLGKDWERTYAVPNTIYVTRQNNLMFTLLAQFMGRGRDR